jgi:sugar phosphate isomerase/epimerase
MGPPELGIRCALAECLDLARSAGFAGIDVDIYEAQRLVAEKGSSYIRDLFSEKGLQIGGWIWFDHFGFSDEEALFREQLAALPALAQVAEAIGATRVLSWILPYSDQLEYGENFARHVARLSRTMDILNAHAQSLALEYIGPKTFREGHPYSFIHTMSEALELLAAVDAPNLGLILDSWHWYTSRATLDELRQLPGSLAVYVHLSDAPANVAVDEQLDHIRCLPGSTGVVDNVGFLKALQEIGYAGPLTAEPFSEEVKALPAQEAARTTAEALSGLCERAGLR